MRLARRILAAEEREQLGRGLGLSAQAELTLRFSLKEALYKALHPLLRRPIAWHSVLVTPRADGSCEVQLDELVQQAGVPLSADARWLRHGDFFVTTSTAEVLPTDGAPRESAEEAGLASVR